jgi:hypothetical protein
VTYEQFIAEIRRLVAESDGLVGATLGTRKFRDWRHEVESTVSNAKSLGFKLPGGFESDARHYRPMWDATPQQIRETFTRDLGDTLTELRFLINHYDKYGAPGERVSVTQPPKTAPLAAPEKVTVRWLLDNVPVLLWVAFGGLLFGSFSIGFALAQSEVSRKFVSFITGLFAGSSALILR